VNPGGNPPSETNGSNAPTLELGSKLPDGLSYKGHDAEETKDWVLTGVTSPSPDNDATQITYTFTDSNGKTHEVPAKDIVISGTDNTPYLDLNPGNTNPPDSDGSDSGGIDGGPKLVSGETLPEGYQIKGQDPNETKDWKVVATYGPGEGGNNYPQGFTTFEDEEHTQHTVDNNDISWKKPSDTDGS
jgi:hypothetical protein